MKSALLALAALLAGGAAAVLSIYYESWPYHAAVRISAPGGVTYAALFDGAPDREACEEAARRYFAPLEKSCAECRVLDVRCAHDAPAIAAAYWVRAEGLRIAVTGPEPNAKASCELTARDLAARGRGGRCEEK